MSQIILFGFGILYFAFKLKISYDTEGGTAGQRHVIEVAVMPPLLVSIGLPGMAPLFGLKIPWWFSILTFILLLFFCWFGIGLAGRLGNKHPIP